ncbi:head GIN domain-containing protein [Melioribacter sp. OK-6-Me]|uniref:head GIN domain-containing protein n=1 Tax=unclassified Melioribacter TaxID=2627329 RepID=UPI003ED9FD92
MKAKIIILLMLAINIAGCGVWGIRGSGSLRTEMREIRNFQKIEVGGAYDIKIKCGEKESIEITAEENLLPLIETKVKQNRLIIDTRRSISPRKEIKIVVTVPELNYIGCSGANNIRVYNVDTEDFDVELSGAGNIEMDGRVKTLHAEISGAGNFDAKSLKAENVYISVSGAASARVYASKYLNASVSGVGSIDYYGDPEKTKTNVSGIGSISRK